MPPSTRPAVAMAPTRLSASSAAAGRVSSPTTSSAPPTSSSVPDEVGGDLGRGDAVVVEVGATPAAWSTNLPSEKVTKSTPVTMRTTVVPSRRTPSVRGANTRG